MYLEKMQVEHHLLHEVEKQVDKLLIKLQLLNMDKAQLEAKIRSYHGMMDED